eukprot:47064_6
MSTKNRNRMRRVASQIASSRSRRCEVCNDLVYWVEFPKMGSYHASPGRTTSCFHKRCMHLSANIAGVRGGRKEHGTRKAACSLSYQYFSTGSLYHRVTYYTYTYPPLHAAKVGKFADTCPSAARIQDHPASLRHQNATKAPLETQAAETGATGPAGGKVPNIFMPALIRFVCWLLSRTRTKRPNTGAAAPYEETVKTMSAFAVRLLECTQHNIDCLRTLNVSLLPAQFPGRFYRDLLQDRRLSRLAYCGSSVVGAVAAHVETDKVTRGRTGSLYVMSLAVTAPHRRMGIGRALLAHLLHTAREDPDFRDIDRLELHVHAANEDALEFYRACGFQDVRLQQNYYPRLDPPHAQLLRLRIQGVPVLSKSFQPEFALAPDETRLAKLLQYIQLRRYSRGLCTHLNVMGRSQPASTGARNRSVRVDRNASLKSSQMSCSRSGSSSGLQISMVVACPKPSVKRKTQNVSNTSRPGAKVDLLLRRVVGGHSPSAQPNSSLAVPIYRSTGHGCRLHTVPAHTMAIVCSNWTCFRQQDSDWCMEKLRPSHVAEKFWCYVIKPNKMLLSLIPSGIIQTRVSLDISVFVPNNYLFYRIFQILV